MAKPQLSKMVRKIPEKYEVIVGKLYKKGRSKPCGVCALGGIALLCNPERFVTKRSKIVDAKSEYDFEVDYETILKEAGVKNTHRKSQFKFDFEPRGRQSGHVVSYYLDEYIYRINDQAKNPVEAVAAGLEKYGY